MLTQTLLDILVDPLDKEALWYFADEQILYNPRNKQRYEVRNGNIPILLAEEAQKVSDSEHDRLMAKASSEQVLLTGNTGKKETDQ